MVAPNMRQRYADSVSDLFDLFDTDHNGVVDHTELVTGLSMLCKGTSDDKISAGVLVLLWVCCVVCGSVCGCSTMTLTLASVCAYVSAYRLASL